jgi:hypothetical protein
MNTGNIKGNNRCEKCELACAMPTKLITAASSRQGFDVGLRVVIKKRSRKDEAS